MPDLRYRYFPSCLENGSMTWFSGLSGMRMAENHFVGRLTRLSYWVSRECVCPGFPIGLVGKARGVFPIGLVGGVCGEHVSYRVGGESW